MDGKLMLLGFAGLLAAVFLLSGEKISLGGGTALQGFTSVKLNAGSGAPKIDKSDPNSFVKKQLGMDRAVGPVAATEHLTAAFIGKVLTDWNEDLSADPPTGITQVLAHDKCTFTPPAAGSRVAYISTGDSNIDSPVFAYSDAFVRKQTELLLSTYRATGEKYIKVYGSSNRMGIYDLAVSDTQFPVHLVLQTSHNIIWNLHLAPGARVTGISILGSRSAGVAGAGVNVPIEILSSDRLKDCQISVQNRSLVNPVFLSSVEAGVISRDEAEKTLKEWEVAQMNYALWFRQQFGLSPSEIVIGYMNGSVGVVGPLPTAKDSLVPYVPFAAKPLVLMTPDRVIVGSYAAFKDTIKTEVMAMANEVTGGDFGIVDMKGN